jgi:hypothetical protein
MTKRPPTHLNLLALAGRHAEHAEERPTDGKRAEMTSETKFLEFVVYHILTNYLYEY